MQSPWRYNAVMPAWGKGWLISFAVYVALIGLMLAVQQWSIVAGLGGVLVVGIFAFGIGQATRDHIRNRRAMAARQRVDEHPQF